MFCLHNTGLSFSLSISIYPSYLSTHPPTYLSYLSIHPSIPSHPIHPFILSVYLSIYLSFSLTSVYIAAVAVQGHCCPDHTRWQTHNPYDSSEWGIGPSQRPLLDNTTDSHPYRRQDSNPHSHQASCRAATGIGQDVIDSELVNLSR